MYFRNGRVSVERCHRTKLNMVGEKRDRNDMSVIGIINFYHYQWGKHKTPPGTRS